MKNRWMFFLLLAGLVEARPVQQSVTGSSSPYREVCRLAAQDERVFERFRTIDGYFHAVECGQVGEFAAYLREKGRKETFSLLSQCELLDEYGTPVRHHVPGFGYFSGTTLRYCLFADLILRLFDLPKEYSVAEIGAGFGGQSYVLSKLAPFGKYYIYDLPEAEMLIEKMVGVLGVPHVRCLNAFAELPEKSVDLFISNYAFSECDRATQLDYFERVIVKAKRGFMLYNDINIYDHLSLSEFIELLQERGMNSKVHPEPVFTYTANALVTWDTTR